MFDPIAYINEPRWQESRLGLERSRALLDSLGRPQDCLRIVHVAGTNGKGSTCVYVAAMLQAAGYRTGLFTSPYIETFEERIRVDGANISLDDLAAATLTVREQAEALAAKTGDHPTEFELMTAVALVHFERSGCDVAVLEVGLGGRLDSTNVIEAPEVTAIARIGLDHTALLGNTLAAVAGEKAGIIKQGVPVVSWPQEPEAMEVIEAVAARHDAPLTMPDFAQLEVGACETATVRGNVQSLRQSCSHGTSTGRSGSCGTRLVDTAAHGCFERTSIVWRFSYKQYRNLQTTMLGSYQPQNAALAIEVVEALRARGTGSDDAWNIPDDAIRAGIAAAVWSGRFEVVAATLGKPTIVVDGGHNPQGAQALADSLNNVFPGQKPIFIIGVLEDKDYPAMLETVLPLAGGFVCITPPSPRALPANKLARAIRWTGQDILGCSACVSPQVATSMEDALAKARSLAGADGLICAFGSLYSIGELKAALRA